MRRSLLALLLLGAQSLLAFESSLSTSLDKARNDFARAAADKSAAETSVAPLAQRVRELKADPNPWFWTQWSLRGDLETLQERLDRLREASNRFEHCRQQLFLILSAMEEEIRSALSRELSMPYIRREKVQELLKEKSGLDLELERMGFGEEKPFPLANLPGNSDSPLLNEDRQRALEARSLQLEAWGDTVREDARLIRRAQASGAINAQESKERLGALEALSQRIASMAKDNDSQLLSKN
jgi:hypothetical protein